MAYTIKEVENKTGVSAHTLKYWAKKGLFSHLDRDENNVRYFDERDLQWVALVQCMRETGMSIAKIKVFVELCKQGEASIPERLAMIKSQESEILEVLEKYNKALEVVRRKIKFYEDALAKIDKDTMGLGTSERLKTYYTKKRNYSSLNDHASAKKRIGKKQ